MGEIERKRMEEQEYRDTYNAVNERRCVFEKTINSRRSTCSRSLRFHLADREGISCRSETGNILCAALLSSMRSNARFALHVTHSDAPLPHAREIKVQTGGLLGLQGLVYPERRNSDSVADIIDIIRTAVARYGDVQSIPYDQVVQEIVRFVGRRKRSRGD